MTESLSTMQMLLGFRAIIIFVIFFSDIAMCLTKQSKQNEKVEESCRPPPESVDSKKPHFSVRLHLVRHGETESNKSNLVMGQSDSPLTQDGIDQAYAANRTIGTKSFWRKYSSDLNRCKKTASIILGLHENHDSIIVSNIPNEQKYNNNHLILDERLRERAKGVKEGRDKRLSYEEAMELFRQERLHEGDMDESNWDIPKLETEDETWHRVKGWIEEIVNDAYEDSLINKTKAENEEGNEYHILGITHSGTLRIIIERMVGQQLNPEERMNEETDQDGKKIGRLSIPNTSITKIDIIADSGDNSNEEHLDIDVPFTTDGTMWSTEKVKWKSQLVELTSTHHLQQINEL